MLYDGRVRGMWRAEPGGLVVRHTVCQRVVKGNLMTPGGAIDNDALRDMFLEEFRRRLKVGRKEIKTDPDLTASGQH